MMSIGFNWRFSYNNFLRKREKKLQKIDKKEVWKRKREISGLKLFVSTIFKATNDPNKYEPGLPKKFGLLEKLKVKMISKLLFG